MTDKQTQVMTPLNIETLSFDSFGRDPDRDIICVAPIRTIVRREEEIVIIRRVRKVEEIDASPACPINTVQVPQDHKEESTEIITPPKPEPSPQPVPPSGAVYVQDYVDNKLSNLYRLDLSTGKATLIGAIATEVFDIACVGSHLYGLDRKDGGQTMQLIEIDPETGESTVIGDIGFAVTGLAYNRQRQTLYALAAKQLIAIDLKTGKGTVAVTVKCQDDNCGEVTFDRNGRAYITLIGYDKKKRLATCDLYSGAINILGDTGYPNLTSMEFLGDVLYGVTGNFFNLGRDGQVIQIDTTTGAGTLITTTEPVRRWAGLSVGEA
ncbi:MAG: hypothetical protein LDL41_00800, partial [Coleofasciculus sp. S288]|nr:hypothetical protein [Coleofasciculus sp. S288]